MKQRCWRSLGRVLVGVAAAAVMAPVWAQPAAAAKPGPAALPTAGCPAVWQHTVPRLQDEKPQALCQYAGQVVLVVNTASYCGFTGQYEGLEALYRRYRAQGLVVLGFPSNDFGQQEPGANAAIADFCENTYGVEFPMFVKTSVVGRDAHPLYRELAQRTGEWPRWNFHKYLVARDGRQVKSYPSAVEPKNATLVADIERMLAAKR